ncbi:FtsK/SpoIIIE domain-containing protein [Leucobacter chromiisoli]|uniref:FtsK/SpoIIIE domain-containing protein n=1 Tax=Leucobacter chromiisoli TaxID=2796471 RepID=UPI0027DB345E|nr:FtsK/SpoIIIE domain-containing protein [Leucobacter chromiisoli]
MDYKGGAAFAECTGLPHTVGLVTDLSPHLVRRALASLRAELRHREEVLAAAGAKDLLAMEGRSDPAAPPSLVIVVDEFAALAAEVPEFVPGVVDIAQRGRSLGLHLVLATQRPAGVITGSLRANTNLRVALRMADEADSTDVIGAKDAAFFDPGFPGRGAIKIGPGRVSRFQCGYLGGRTSGRECGPDIEVRSLGFAEEAPWDIPPDPASAGAGSSEPVRDIERLRDGIALAARAAGIGAARRPWLDALPKLLDLDDVRRRAEAAPPGGADAAVVGLRDEPEAQRQTPLAIDFEEVGSIAIVGASGTGKTSALLSLTASLSATTSHPVQIYAVDAGGGALDALSALPTVGAVAPLADAELVARVLRHVLAVVADRGPRYASARAGTLSDYRRAHPEEPRIVLLVDGFAAFRQAAEAPLPIPEPSPAQVLGEIIVRGRSVGVHVVVTCDRPAAIPAAMSAGLQQRYAMRLADRHDYAQLSVSADALENAPPGRALTAGGHHELQFALIEGAADHAGQAAGLERIAASLRADGVQQAPVIRNAPETIPLRDLDSDAAGRPAYGIDTRSLEPVGLPGHGLGVVSGPAGSGLSTAMLACVQAAGRRAEREAAMSERILLTFTSDGLALAGAWDRIACGEEEVGAAARELAGALREKRGAPLVAVERPAEAEGTRALPELVALAKAARRSPALVLFEFETGTAGAIWELLAALRQPGWGLALQPDEGEGQTPFREPFGRVRRADFPPGRGFAIENGRVVPVQVARPDGWPDAACELGGDGSGDPGNGRKECGILYDRPANAGLTSE